MDALKHIPQIFFDAIGRVVPGAVAFALWIVGVPNAAGYWRSFLQGAQGLSSTGEPSSAVALATLMLASYVVGHLLSPLTKLIQRIGEAFSKPKDKAKVAPAQNQEQPKPIPTTPEMSRSEKYEWLRTHAPDAGAHCAKLRAEFTMYNSLSARARGCANIRECR